MFLFYSAFILFFFLLEEDCVSGGKNVRFSENLACFVFLLPPFSDSPFCHITDDIDEVSDSSDVSVIIIDQC